MVRVTLIININANIGIIKRIGLELLFISPQIRNTFLRLKHKMVSAIIPAIIVTNKPIIKLVSLSVL